MLISLNVCRHARHEERQVVRLLPGTVRGHHVHDNDQTENVVLFLQPDRAVRAHLVHGPLGLHAAAGLRRKADAR